MKEFETQEWKAYIRKWSEVNPNRTESVTKKLDKKPSYLFQPYYDGGLYSGSTVKELLEGKNMTLRNGKTVFNKVEGFDSITLAFVQQVVGNTTSLELTVAGQPSGEGYDWWVDNKFKPEVIMPLVANKGFKNIVVAYGGAASAVGYNPWDVAYTLANKNIDEAVALLMPALIGFQKTITEYAGLDPNKDMPMNLDLDIEGVPFDEDHIAGMTVLFTTLAKMKLADANWKFSITLPVLRSGLVARDLDNVLHPALTVFKEQGLADKSNLFDLNIMAMNYGEITGDEIVAEGITFFDVAKDATQNTGRQYQSALETIWGITVTEEEINRKLMVTPMLGINDVNNNYFTLEDAKDLYNWCQEKELGALRIWSFNRDDSGQITSGASITDHGLKYLNLWDFTHVFTGDWTDWVKEPVREV